MARIDCKITYTEANFEQQPDGWLQEAVVSYNEWRHNYAGKTATAMNKFCTAYNEATDNGNKVDTCFQEYTSRAGTAMVEWGSVTEEMIEIWNEFCTAWFGQTNGNQGPVTQTWGETALNNALKKPSILAGDWASDEGHAKLRNFGYWFEPYVEVAGSDIANTKDDVNFLLQCVSYGIYVAYEAMNDEESKGLRGADDGDVVSQTAFLQGKNNIRDKAFPLLSDPSNYAHAGGGLLYLPGEAPPGYEPHELYVDEEQAAQQGWLQMEQDRSGKFVIKTDTVRESTGRYGSESVEYALQYGAEDVAYRFEDDLEGLAIDVCKFYNWHKTIGGPTGLKYHEDSGRGWVPGGSMKYNNWLYPAEQGQWDISKPIGNQKWGNPNSGFSMDKERHPANGFNPIRDYLACRGEITVTWNFNTSRGVVERYDADYGERAPEDFVEAMGIPAGQSMDPKKCSPEHNPSIKSWLDEVQAKAEAEHPLLEEIESKHAGFYNPPSEGFTHTGEYDPRSDDAGGLRYMYEQCWEQLKTPYYGGERAWESDDLFGLMPASQQEWMEEYNSAGQGALADQLKSAGENFIFFTKHGASSKIWENILAKAQELRSEGAIPNILSKLVDKLKPKFERLYYLWNEVDEAKDEWNQCRWDVEEETEDAYDTFVKELAKETGMKRSDVRDVWPFTLEMEEDFVLKWQDISFDEAMEEHYRRNPHKIFFKEQCYLLTYIASLAAFKKNNIDAGASRDGSRTSIIEGAEELSEKLHKPGFTPTAEKPGCDVETEDCDAGVWTTAVNWWTEGTGGEILENIGVTQTAKAIGAAWNGLETDNGKWSPKRLPYTLALAKKTGISEEDAIWPGNACLLVDGDPYAFLNYLTISKNQEPYMNIPHHILSELQPYVRLYKVVFDDNGKEYDIPITMAPYRTGLESTLYKSEKYRNTGVGLESFQFTYDGSNPFGAKKSIKAQLSITANSFNELLYERGSGANKYRYVDLALKTFNTGSPKNSKYGFLERENEELGKLNFRLKAQVGLAVPTDKSFVERYKRADLKRLRRALYDSTVTLNLTPTVHDFQFEETGQVSFSINYLAYVEDLFSQAKFNVFSEPSYALRRIVRNLEVEYFNEKCESEAAREIKKSYAAIAQSDVADSIAHLMSTMMHRKKLYYVRLSQEQVKEFISHGPFSDKHDDKDAKPKVLMDADYEAQLLGSIAESLSVYKKQAAGDSLSKAMEDEEEAITSALAAMDENATTMSFFYVADLIDIILENIEVEIESMPELLEDAAKRTGNKVPAEKLELKKDEYLKYSKAIKRMRFLLGPVEFVNPTKGGESYFANLGDIPISTKYFFEWLTSTMLNKEENFFALSSFMNEFFNDLINKFLNTDRCFQYSIRQRTHMQQATITGHVQPDTAATYPDGHLDPVTYQCLRKKTPRINILSSDLPIPLLKSSGPATDSARTRIKTNDEVNYMVYFAGRTLPTEQMKGIKSKDEEKGIFHYQVGRIDGIVKTIDLKKTQTKGLTEVRFEQSGYDGLEQLLVVYDAKITTYANVNTFPGSYIFIQPKGWSPGAAVDLTRFGIGGYYMIVRSTHEFAAGKAESVIEAKWVNKIDSEAKASFVKHTAGQNDKVNSKCERHVERAANAKEQLIPSEGD